VRAEKQPKAWATRPTPTLINAGFQAYYVVPAAPPVVNWIYSGTKNIGTTNGMIFQVIWGTKDVACNTVVSCDNFLRPN